MSASECWMHVVECLGGLDSAGSKLVALYDKQLKLLVQYGHIALWVGKARSCDALVLLSCLQVWVMLAPPSPFM